MRWFRFQRTHPIRLESQPWTGRERRKRLSEWTGTVVAKSENGIKVVDGGAWLNWTKLEWRGQPFNTDVRAGDKVRVEYATVDGKTYISVIENLSRPASGEPDDPFPPQDDFPGDAPDFPPDAPESPSEPTIDKDHLIVRQVAIKAACEALAMSPLETEEKAGRITYLAGVLEDWCWR